MEQSKNIISYFSRFIDDRQMYPSHISLYVALFQLWSINKFQTPFSICRRDVMKLSKIKSFATYHKCIREIHEAGFIIYKPSYNSFEGSLIEIIDTEIIEGDCIKVIRNQKQLQTAEALFSVPTLSEIQIYFNERDIASEEANQFYIQYQSRDWTLNNGKPMRCWKSAARMWISKLNMINNL